MNKILSVAFELAEYSLQHQLPNFAEASSRLAGYFLHLLTLIILQCWWDHVSCSV